MLPKLSSKSCWFKNRYYNLFYGLQLWVILTFLISPKIDQPHTLATLSYILTINLESVLTPKRSESNFDTYFFKNRVRFRCCIVIFFIGYNLAVWYYSDLIIF